MSVRTRPLGPLCALILAGACARTPIRLAANDGGAGSVVDASSATDSGGDVDASDAGGAVDAGDAGTVAITVPTWGTPFRISSDAGVAFEVAVPPHATGITDVLWSQTSGEITALVAVRVDADGSVGPPETIAAFDAGVIINPRASTNSSLVIGAAIFLWASTFDAGAPRQLWGARRISQWYTAVPVHTGASASYPSLAQFSPDGFLGAWTTYSPMDGVRWIRSDGTATNWFDAGTLDAGNPMVMGAAMTDDWSANAVIALNSCDMGMGQMSCQITAQWHNGASWQMPYRVDTAGGEMYSAPFVAARSTNAVVTWFRRSVSYYNAELAAAHCTNSGCSPQQTVKTFLFMNADFTHSDGPRNFDLNINSAYDSLIVYGERDAGVFISHATGPTGPWSTPTRLASLPAQFPVAASTSNNTFVVAWRTPSSVFATRVVANSTEANTSPVALFSGAATMSDLRIGAVGSSLLAVWVADGVVWGAIAK